MTGVERLQHVEGLAAANFADDDAVGTHAQRAANEIAHTDRTGAFCVGGACLQPHDVRLTEPQLGRLLDRDDALTGIDRRRERVQQRRLARARRPGHEQVPPTAHRGPDKSLRFAAEVERVETDGTRREAADREAGSVRCEWRENGMYPRAVGETRVGNGRRPVEAQTERSDDPLREPRDLRPVEPEIDRNQAPGALHVRRARDH